MLRNCMYSYGYSRSTVCNAATVGRVLIASIYILIANCEFFYVSQLIDSHRHERARILRYSTGSSIAIIGFAIWPDLTRTQLLTTQLKPVLRYISRAIHRGFCTTTLYMYTASLYCMYMYVYAIT